jgi:hypothetical protein
MVNGWPAQRDLLKRIGVSALALMKRLDVTDLSASFGLGPDALAALPDRWSKHHVDFGSHRVSRTQVVAGVRRICRACLAENPVSRFEWELAFITNCPEHGPLSADCECGRPLTWQDRHLAACNQCPAPRAIQPPRAAGKVVPPHPFQRYALGRLERLQPTTSEVLDPLPLDLVVSVVQNVGAMLTAGFSSVSPLALAGADPIGWAETGFAWLQRPTVGNELQAIVDRYRTISGVVCPREPVMALGFLADLPALHFRKADALLALLRQRLSHALGYPVNDLWRTDYWDLGACAAATNLSAREFLCLLHERGWHSSCHAHGNDLFVPVDTLWHAGQAAKGAPASTAYLTGQKP